MLGDSYCKISTAQSITAATSVAPVVSTSSIDRLAAADIGGGTSMRVAFNTDTALVPGVAALTGVGIALTTVTIAAPGVATYAAHGLAVGTPIVIADGSTSLPTGLVAGTIYYATVVTTNTFQFATTLANAQAGTGVTTTGTATAVKITPVTSVDFQVIGADDAALTTGVVVLGASGPISYRATRQVTSFTVSGAVIALTAHGMSPGTPVQFSVSGAGALPTGITAAVTYYVILGADADKFVLASSRENALAGIADVTFSTTGTAPMLVRVTDGFLSAAGTQVFVDINPQEKMHRHKRYIGARYVTNSHVFAGAFSALLVSDVDQGTQKYPSGFTV